MSVFKDSPWGEPRADTNVVSVQLPTDPPRRDGDAMPAEGSEAVTAMTPDEFQATVKTLCDPLTRLAPRDVMHFTCLRLVKTVDVMAAGTEKIVASTRERIAEVERERDALAKRCEADRWVPVAERLPDAMPEHWSEWVLGMTYEGKYVVDCCYRLADGATWLRAGPYSHWRPIIGPPAESAAQEGTGRHE